MERSVDTNHIYSTMTGGHTSAHEDCEWCTDAATNMGAAYGTDDRYIHLLTYYILSYKSVSDTPEY